jgi:hypothetical protein
MSSAETTRRAESERNSQFIQGPAWMWPRRLRRTAMPLPGIWIIGSTDRSCPLPIPLFPVRPPIRADHAAPSADHARPELSHQEIARVFVDVQDHLVPTALAHDVERPHAVLAHVREVHGLDFVLEPVGHGIITRLLAP